MGESMDDYITRVHEWRDGPTDLARMNGKKDNRMGIILGKSMLWKSMLRILQKLVPRSW